MTSTTKNGAERRTIRKQLRKQARELIERDQLPITRPLATWGSRGSGDRCALCGLKIGFAEAEIEADFARARGASHPEKLFFHGSCFAEFELERDRVRTENRPAHHKTGGEPATLR